MNNMRQDVNVAPVGRRLEEIAGLDGHALRHAVRPSNFGAVASARHKQVLLSPGNRMRERQ
jgi:hypothetical protein